MVIRRSYKRTKIQQYIRKFFNDKENITTIYKLIIDDLSLMDKNLMMNIILT